MSTLFGPADGNTSREPLEGQVIRLATLQDGVDDVGGQEGARKNLAHISFCHAGLSHERLLIECLAFEHVLVPAIYSRKCFHSEGLVLEASVALGFGGTIR